MLSCKELGAPTNVPSPPRGIFPQGVLGEGTALKFSLVALNSSSHVTKRNGRNALLHGASRTRILHSFFRYNLFHDHLFHHRYTSYIGSSVANLKESENR